MENPKFDTLLYLICMLKAYGIKTIIASPGMQNAKFNSLVQDDDYFTCYSVVDERSAVYVASGLSYEKNEPVVITCTGATSSRNYLSGMTEAFYREVPIIAITFFNYDSNSYSLAAQYVDRSSTQNDIKSLAVELPKIFDASSKKRCLTYLNAALLTAKYKHMPVHINCPALHDYQPQEYVLPQDIWVTNYHSKDFSKLKNDLKNKTFAIFIGSHKKFNSEEETAISDFAKSWDCSVICDHTSNYHGCNKVLTSKISYKNLSELKPPEVLLDIGNITGEYSSSKLFSKSKIWRISQNGKFQCRYNLPVENFFDCKEQYFFEQMKNIEQKTNGYYSYIKDNVQLQNNEQDLPLSNGLICKELVKHIPKHSSLHLSILNSLRNMNFYNIDETIDVVCNVGGFGIDGAISTLVGQSLANPEKKCFGIIGDLAFFYDLNILGNRHIEKNIRIIVVNNSRGEEFRINPTLENNLHEKTDVLIAAAGHNKGGAEKWAQSCGFTYLKAETIDEFKAQIYDFCTKNYNSSVIFEVFTDDEKEKQSLAILKSEKEANKKKQDKEKINLFSRIKNAFKQGN